MGSACSACKDSESSSEWRGHDPERSDFSQAEVPSDVFQVKYRDKEAALQAVKSDGRELRFVSEDLRGDKEIVLQALKAGGFALQFASEELRADKELVLQAVRESESALRSASDNLQSDKEVVLEAVRSHSNALLYARAEFQEDKEVVLEAVRMSGCALLHASETMRADKDVVLEAVRRDGNALEYASDSLREDKDVVLEAVRERGFVLQYAGNNLRQDKELLLLAARWEGTHPYVMRSFLKEAGIDRRVGECSIAVAGERGCPTVSVFLTRIAADVGVGGCVRGAQQFHCDVYLMSGRAFECDVEETGTDCDDGARNALRSGPTLEDLAKAIVQKLPTHLETSSERVFINFAMGSENEPVGVTPWDWNRPLADFLPRAE